MKRLVNNWVTSILGLVIIIVAVYLLAFSKTDYVGFTALVTLALTLLRAKDSLLGLEAK